MAQFHFGRWGAAIETRRWLFSLGWNVWGFDAAGRDLFLIVHIWPPALFARLGGDSMYWRRSARRPER
jgi:hypothetical protein